MDKLVLRNNRLDCGTWFFTACAFAAGAFVCLCGLIVMNVRDPKALWMGPQVSHPQGIYLFLDVLTLLWMSGMVGLAVFKGKKFFDRSVQLVIDETGVHDLRAAGQDVSWSQVADLVPWSLYSGHIATAAQLKLKTKDGPTIGVDILGLDQDHKSIQQEAAKIMEAVARRKQNG